MTENTASPFPQMPAHSRDTRVESTNIDGASREIGALKGALCRSDAHGALEPAQNVSIDDLPESLRNDRARLTSIAHRVRQARFSYDKKIVLAGEVSHRQVPALLVCLARQGLLDVAADQTFWELYAAAETILNTSEILDFLQAVDLTADHGWLEAFPGWPQPIDTLVTLRFARDPQPLRDVFATLAPTTRRGLALVRARFGERAPLANFGDLTEEFARFFASTSIASVILWPSANPATSLEARALFDPRPMIPNQNFDDFLTIFTTPDAFGRALLTAVLDPNQVILGTPHTLRHAAQVASVPDMARLLVIMAQRHASPELLKQSLCDWRTDDGETLAQIALALAPSAATTSSTDLRSMAAALAIIKLRDEGKEIPAILLEAMTCVASAPTMNRILTAIAALPAEVAKNPAAIDAAYSLAEPGAMFPASQPIFQALARLPADTRREQIDAAFNSPETAKAALPFLCLIDDLKLWQRGINLCLAAATITPTMTFGLGNLPLKALPQVFDAWVRAKEPHRKYPMRIALLAMMARAADSGTLWEPRWDRLVSFDVVAQDDEYLHFAPLLRKIIYHLPTERAEPVLLRALDARNTFARAFQLAASHPTQAVAEAAFHALLVNETMLTPLEKDMVTDGLLAFDDVRPLVTWLIRNGGGTYLSDLLERALGGRDQLDALRHELTQQGAKLTEELDPIGQLAARAQRLGGGSETIYALRRLDTRPAHPTLNLIGAAAPGVSPERWPTHAGEPMTHLFTLDLDTMPPLKARHPHARTLSLFCYRPYHNNAWEPGTDHTALRFCTQEQIDTAATYEPSTADPQPRAWFEPVAIPVAPDAFDAGSDLAQHIYQASARVLGQPLWLQDAEHDGEFLMQFDDRFVDVNLGDMGVMYVFTDTAFWQCH